MLVLKYFLINNFTLGNFIKIQSYVLSIGDNNN